MADDEINKVRYWHAGGAGRLPAIIKLAHMYDPSRQYRRRFMSSVMYLCEKRGMRADEIIARATLLMDD